MHALEIESDLEETPLFEKREDGQFVPKFCLTRSLVDLSWGRKGEFVTKLLKVLEIFTVDPGLLLLLCLFELRLFFERSKIFNCSKIAHDIFALSHTYRSEPFCSV